MRREIYINTALTLLFSFLLLLPCFISNAAVAWVLLGNGNFVGKIADHNNQTEVTPTIHIPNKFSFTITDDLINTKTTVSGMLPSGNLPYKIEDEYLNSYHTVLPVGNISDRYKVDGEKSSLVFSLVIDSREENYSERLDIANAQFPRLKRVEISTEEIPDINTTNTHTYSTYHPFTCVFKTGQCIFTDLATGYPLIIRCESKAGDFSDCDEIIKTLKVESVPLRS